MSAAQLDRGIQPGHVRCLQSIRQCPSEDRWEVIDNVRPQSTSANHQSGPCTGGGLAKIDADSRSSEDLRLRFVVLYVNPADTLVARHQARDPGLTEDCFIAYSFEEGLCVTV